MITLSKSLVQFSILFSPEKLFGELEFAGLSTKLTHSRNVSSVSQNIVSAKIFPFEEINLDLLSMVASLHDIGRAIQYDVVGSYDDLKCEHQACAAQLIWKYIRENDVDITADWRVLLDVCMYHGRPVLWSLADNSSLSYLKIVSAADMIENGCISAPRYLEREKGMDSKGYIERNSNLNQKRCAEKLIEHLENGESFDKYALCETYAGYFIFAGTLAAVACREYDAVAKNAMEECGSLKEYLRIYEAHLDQDLSDRACKALVKYCR